MAGFREFLGKGSFLFNSESETIPGRFDGLGGGFLKLNLSHLALGRYLGVIGPRLRRSCPTLMGTSATDRFEQ